MPTLEDLCHLLDAFAPPHLAEEWDNTGLLLGDPHAEAVRVMTCLTLTPESVQEAVEQSADLVIAHHPLPFRPVKRITTTTVEGRLLWTLATAGIAVYSPHTSFDSAPQGINARLAAGLGVMHAAPLVPDESEPAIGAGRVGELKFPAKLDDFAMTVKQFLAAPSVKVVGPPSQMIKRVAVACGSGASFLPEVLKAKADALVTGEATFHNCLAAEANNLALVLPGHYASERFALEKLAEWLASQASGLTVWASRLEQDPLRTLG